MNSWTAEISMIATAFIAGLLGSGHCMAMCGGLAIALNRAPANAAPNVSRTLLLLQQLARVLGYAIVGALVGAFGASLLFFLDHPGARLAIQVAGGAIAFYFGLSLALGKQAWPWLEKAGFQVWKKIVPHSGQLLPVDTPWRALVTGVLWGWLPCGMVYGMLLFAWSTSDALSASLVMLAFGLGTLPALWLTATSSQRLRYAARQTRWRVAGGLLIMLLGLLPIFSPWWLPHGHLHVPGLLECATG